MQLAKDVRWRSKKYTDWVATLPCTNCGADDGTVVAHHLKHRYEKTMAESEAKARCSKEYKDWREQYEDAVADFEIMKSHRGTAQVLWETWRTEQANLRRS